jgi:16S rRNA (guanine527-N7)-methyltransferase
VLDVAAKINPMVPSENRIQELLQPFGLQLDSHQVSQLKTYLELLLRWNARINLTAIRDAEECVTRHFGESLFLSCHEQLRGRLLDIGSGAGFPGLALKIIFPELEITLLELVAKKRAFLKEVARQCDFEKVVVSSQRLEEISDFDLRFDAATARAVGQIERLVTQAASILVQGGRLHLWLSREQAARLKPRSKGLQWVRQVDLPLSRGRVILTGGLCQSTFIAP